MDKPSTSRVRWLDEVVPDTHAPIAQPEWFDYWPEQQTKPNAECKRNDRREGNDHSRFSEANSMFLADEQERIQKATFTKWCNAQLAKHPNPVIVGDLYEDLRDGVALITLIEVLTGDRLVSCAFVVFDSTVKSSSNVHAAPI